MSAVRICPVCKGEYTEAPAMSRVDNQLICPDCGYREALDVAVKYGIIDVVQRDRILSAIKEAHRGRIE